MTLVTYTLISMTLDAALAAAATLVALAFGLATFDRWQRRRRAHELAWSISLALFTLGSGALWWAEAHGWSSPVFRLFFLAGAVLNVPWLALGTVYLLGGQRVGDRIRSWLIFLSGLAVGIIIVAPTKAVVAGNELPQGSAVFGLGPRLLAAIGSGLPATLIIVGALWSAWRVLRGRVPAIGNAARRNVALPRRLAVGNIVIAAGSIVLSMSGTFAGRLGQDRAFAVTLLVGIVLLFTGFLIASSGASRTTTTLSSVDGGQLQRSA